MTLTLPLLGLAGVFLALILRPLLSPLRSVPGPFIARWSNAWYLWKVWHGDFEKTNKHLHDVYGPIVRYGPNRYSFSEPTATDTIYGHGSHFTKSSWYSTWTSPPALTGPGVSPGSVSIFGDQSISRHSHNRKQFQSNYSMTSLVSYEPYVDECAGLFAQRLQEIATAGVAVNMQHWFQCYAFDVIGMITYDKRLGFLDGGEDVGGVMGTLANHFTYATLVGIYPSLHPFLYRLGNLIAGKRGAGRGYILNFTTERISERRAGAKAAALEGVDQDLEAHGSKTESLLSKFLSKHNTNPGTFTPDHVKAGCVFNMVAGSDSTAITLSAAFHYLLLNRDSLQRLQDEVDAFQSEGNLSRHPTFKESLQMPYLQAVIKETLRMHPATGLPLERVVPEEGASIGGLQFPKGTIVGVNPWVEHRNRAVFGDDADLFRPERWLEEDSERVKTMNRNWIPFGLGSRTCIGRHISMLELSKMIPRLIRDFEFSHDVPSNTGSSWPTRSAWIVKPTNFNLRVVRRNKASE